MFLLNISGIAKACEQNLKKTFQYGGRIVPPNSMELKAMMVCAFGLFVYLHGCKSHANLLHK